MKLACPCCGREVEESERPGLFLNARLSLRSDLVQLKATIDRLPAKGAEAIREVLQGRYEAHVQRLRLLGDVSEIA